MTSCSWPPSATQSTWSSTTSTANGYMLPSEADDCEMPETEAESATVSLTTESQTEPAPSGFAVIMLAFPLSPQGSQPPGILQVEPPQLQLCPGHDPNTGYPPFHWPPIGKLTPGTNTTFFDLAWLMRTYLGGYGLRNYEDYYGTVSQNHPFGCYLEIGMITMFLDQMALPYSTTVQLNGMPLQLSAMPCWVIMPITFSCGNCVNPVDVALDRQVYPCIALCHRPPHEPRQFLSPGYITDFHCIGELNLRTRPWRVHSSRLVPFHSLGWQSLQQRALQLLDHYEVTEWPPASSSASSSSAPSSSASSSAPSSSASSSSASSSSRYPVANASLQLSQVEAWRL